MVAAGERPMAVDTESTDPLCGYPPYGRWHPSDGSETITRASVPQP